MTYPIRMTNTFRRRWLLGGALTIGAIASFVLIAYLIRIFLVMEIVEPFLPGGDSSVSAPAPPTLARHELPMPSNTKNRRTLYPECPDCWGWQAPWFQNIPVEGGMTGLLGQFYKRDEIYKFELDSSRQSFGENQFLVELGQNKTPWLIAAKQGSLQFVNLTNDKMQTISLPGVGPDISAVTKINLSEDVSEEILVASQTTNTIWVFRMDGIDIQMIQKVEFDTKENAGIRFIQSGDLSGNKEKTLLVATNSELRAFTIRQGQIVSPPRHIATFWGIESLLVHDFTEDGKDEILIADWDSVMSLFNLDDGKLIEIDHLEFPVKLFPTGRRSPTVAKLIEADGDPAKELLIVEKFAPGRATQRVHLYGWDAKKDMLTPLQPPSSQFIQREEPDGVTIHLEEVFPINFGDRLDRVLIIGRAEREGSAVSWLLTWGFPNGPFLGHQSGQSLDFVVRAKTDPFLGAILLRDRKLIIAKNGAIVLPRKEVSHAE